MVRSAREKKAPGIAATRLRQTLWLLGFGDDTCANPLPDLPAFVHHHGVAGILDAERLTRVPVPLFAALQAERMSTAKRALRLSATLARVSKYFSDCGVRHVAIKGPALAQQVYGRVSARSGLDVDILVPAESWSGALATLAELEFRLAGKQNVELASGTHELVFHHATLTQLELHRRLLRRRYTLPSWNTEGVASIDVHGIAVPTLTPTFALPYLAAHANQHAFRRLIWLMDVLSVLRHREFDAGQAAWLSRRADLGGVVNVCFTLLQRLFAIELPVALQKLQRRSWACDALIEHALTALADCSSDLEVTRRIGMARRVAIDVGLQRTAPGKMQALGDWLSPTARDESWLALPRPMRAFYPAIRLARLLVQRR